MEAKNKFNLASWRALACGALAALLAVLPACVGAETKTEAEAEAEAEAGAVGRAEEPALNSVYPLLRSFVCGFALPGYNCNNGRTSRYVNAIDLTAAIAACPSVRPTGYTDSCHVLAADGGIDADVPECSAASGSWRPGNSCCNFKGTLSCPVTRSYVCGFALPGYNCNNGRISRYINTADMTAAIAACPSVRPTGYTDSCYVIDSTGGTAADAVDCSAASGSWRPGNSCCNFKGTLSCPL